MAGTSYSRTNSFRQFAEENPTSPLPGQKVDQELDGVAASTQSLAAALAQIQRDDGALRNQVVKNDSLSNEVLALIASADWTPRGDWVTATDYIVSDLVKYNEATYVCIAAHTSAAAFATDAANWVVIANNAAGSIQQYVGVFSGDGAQTVFTLAYSYADENSLALVAVGGVVQRNGIDFTLAGDQLTFTDAPPNTANNILVVAAGSAFVQALADAQTAATAAQTAQGLAEAARDDAQLARDAAQLAEGGATTQAGIATTKAGEAADSAAVALAATVGKYDARISLTAVDSPYTVASLTADTLINVDTTGGSVVINLPASAGEADGRLIAINKVGATNTVTVNPDGADTIGGLASFVQYDDTEWADLYLDKTAGDWQLGNLSYTSAGAGLEKIGSTIGLADGGVSTAKLANGAVTAVKASVATQAQAEAGTDATTLMTPQRTAQAIAALGASAFGSALLHIQHQEVSGTNGGTTGAGWNTRPLTAVVTNEIVGASLAANLITLPAGTYYIEAESLIGQSNLHKAKLVNSTDAADILLGSTEYAPAAAVAYTHSLIRGRFTLAATKDVYIAHYSSSAQVGNGFGIAGSLGAEIYADVRIWKIV